MTHTQVYKLYKVLPRKMSSTVDPSPFNEYLWCWRCVKLAAQQNGFSPKSAHRYSFCTHTATSFPRYSVGTKRVLNDAVLGEIHSGGWWPDANLTLLGAGRPLDRTQCAQTYRLELLTTPKNPQPGCIAPYPV